MSLSGKPYKPGIKRKKPPKSATDPENAHKRKMWISLHTYAARYSETPDGDQVRSAGEWLEKWASQMPNTCPCKQEWLDILKIEKPPLKEGRGSFFWWTVAAHDRVNILLGRTLWTSRSKTSPLLQNLLLPDNSNLQNHTRRMNRKPINQI